MKTGRVRKKRSAPVTKPEPESAAKPSSAAHSGTKPTPATSGVPQRVPSSLLIPGLFAVIVIFIMVIAIMMISRGGTDEWVTATNAEGSWTTSVTLLGPQITVEERWEIDCINDPDSNIRPGSCVARETDTYQDKVVDDYEEYAYDIYYEETWDKIYQAQGTEFSVAELGTDDYWEGNRHYTREEELDRDSCKTSEYTLWVDDRQDPSQEVEVYLAVCEVWDHVTVSERVYDRGQWCACETTTLVPLGSDVNQGVSKAVLWPEVSAPPGGQTERHFYGTVVFEGDGYTYSATTEDLDEYIGFLSGQYYIGLRDGRPVTISRNPPRD